MVASSWVIFKFWYKKYCLQGIVRTFNSKRQERVFSFFSKKRISSDDISKCLRPHFWKWYLQDFKKQFSGNATAGVNTYKIYYPHTEQNDSTVRRAVEE